MKHRNQKGKYTSLEELYLDNYRLVYTYIGDYTENWEVLQELSSIVWMKVAENPIRYLNMDKVWLQNYLRIMTRTISLDYFEKETRYRGHLTEDSLEFLEDIIRSNTTEEEFFRQEDLRYLKEARKSLTMEENEIITLRFEAELSAQAIGEAFGLSEGTLRVKQHRILKKLKAEITGLRNGGK